jgi:hypothetical protein
MLLKRIVEEVTGVPYRDLIAERIARAEARYAAERSVSRAARPRHPTRSGQVAFSCGRRATSKVVNERTEYTCTECAWSVSDAVRPNEEPSRLAIEHYVESGHSIEREDDPDGRGRAPVWSSRG